MSLLERIYHFHEELLRNRYPTAKTLVEQFEVSTATARRDIAYLRDRLLAPIAFDQIKNGFYYTTEGFTLPFEESPKILFFLGMLSKMAEEAGLGRLSEVQTLEKKLSNLVFHEHSRLVDAIHCEWVEVETPEPELFETVIEATVRRKVLYSVYRSLQGETSERELEPQRLVNYQGRWYLLAHCRLRNALRLFHIARFAQAIMTKKSFTPEEETLLTTYLDSAFGIFKGKIRYTASILFMGTAAELVSRQKWHSNQRIEWVEKGAILHVPVGDNREITMKILQYGSLAKVLAPDALKKHVP